MGLVQQILLGTLVLGLCALIHVGMIAFSIPVFGKVSARVSKTARAPLRICVFLSLAVFVLVFAHTLQIWTWALTFLEVADIPDLETGFYFATVTYTTLGYGDIVLGPEARILATFCAITDLLTFGISTAFLIGVLSKILPDISDNS